MRFLDYFYLLVFLCVGCSNHSGGGDQTTTPATPTETPESSECLTNHSYTSGVMVSGTAVFYKRGLNITTSGATVTQAILGAPLTTFLPIQYAEVQVTDSAGQVIQCGKTNSSGQLKALDGSSNLTISNTAGTYTIKVFSRSHKTLSVPNGKTAFDFYLSVKKDIYSNELYALSTTTQSNGSSTSTVSLVAYADETHSSEITGGAFNIYNDILTAYNYLGQNTGTSNLTCLNPKLEVFWKAGFNPAQYLYPSEDPSSLSTLSYYVRGDNQLYINGGKLGNVTTQDTDHFDDAVIIHELGHHIEDVCGKMDSPGGTHYGLYRIDPRLAWSEGWGNFFGAHIIRNNIASINPDLSSQLSSADGWLYYLDTEGYSEGSQNNGAEMIRLTLSKPGTSPECNSSGTCYDKVYPVLNPGEGHTREVSISRSLFKNTNSCSSTCVNQNYFAYYWKAFENDSAQIGMGKSSYPFRSSARFYSRLNQAFSGSMPAAIDNILNTDEAQQRDGNSAYTNSGYATWAPYAVKLVSSGVAGATSPCPVKIFPRTQSSNTTNSLSDQRFSNHFYTLDLGNLTGVTEINLNVAQVAGSTVDFDLILLKEGYKFTEDCSAYDNSGACSTYQKMTGTDMVRYDRSNSTYPKKIQTLNSLSTGSYYLLNVRAYTGNQTILNTTEYSYTLKDQTGVYLCPTSPY